MHEEGTARPMSVPSSVAATTTQPTATDHSTGEPQVSYSSGSAAIVICRLEVKKKDTLRPHAKRFRRLLRSTEQEKNGPLKEKKSLKH
ncbi:Uncharacterized protein GBIM_00904 [Gryllus bimaculatus]|nr:Uncharacterized protein GBIM_00904 [Gryllus bimaculatus]